MYMYNNTVYSDDAKMLYYVTEAQDPEVSFVHLIINCSTVAVQCVGV